MVKTIILPLLIIITVISGYCAPDANRESTPRLNGTFIQIQPWMRQLTVEDWRRELVAMRRAGLRIIIIQYLASDENRFIPSESEAVDITAEILSFSAKNEMRVFVGLKIDSQWWHKNREREYLARALNERMTLANEIHARYGRHTAFAGWYIADECWDQRRTQGEIEILREYLRDISEHCKQLRNRRVALAPFFSGTMPPEDVEQMFNTLLKGTGIDILLLQDGVGARGWDKDMEMKITPYFRAFKRVCGNAGMALWADLECFRKASGKNNSFVPANIRRIARQLETETPYVSKIIVFDFFHYMSPYRGDKSALLYQDYRGKFNP